MVGRDYEANRPDKVVSASASTNGIKRISKAPINLGSNLLIPTNEFPSSGINLRERPEEGSYLQSTLTSIIFMAKGGSAWDF
jgi:hypothetical protein